MYRVVEKVWTNVYKVLNTGDGTVEFLSTSELVFALGLAKINGCRHTKNGIEVRCKGVASEEFSIEVWASVENLHIIDTDGRWNYEVSNLGNVRKVRPIKIDEVKNIRVRDKMYRQAIPLKKSKTDSGYVCVYMTGSDKRSRRVSVRLLVASAFVYNPRKSKTVVHINGDVSDCSASNLEWFKRDKDKTNRLTSLRSVIRGKYAAISAEPPDIITDLDTIRQYSLTGNLVSEFSCATAAEKATGFDARGIVACCRRSCKVSQSFIWRFCADDEFYRALQDGSTFEDIKKMFISYIGAIRQYTKDKIFVAEYTSISAASSATGISTSGIGSCCRRYSKTSNGFLWRFEADDEFADIPENATVIEEWRKAHSV